MVVPRTVALILASFCALGSLGIGADDRPAEAVRADSQGQSEAGTDRQKLVGTYRLVSTERGTAGGSWTQTPNFNSIGYITYSESGYMGVHIMPKNRARFAGNQPTPEEAQKALQGYAAYYGPFVVNEKEKFVIHKRTGQINPGGPPEVKRFYEFSGNRLILTPEPASGGKAAATNRIVWEAAPQRAALCRSQKVHRLPKASLHRPLHREGRRDDDARREK